MFAYFLPVFADEAYYYVWSLRPQLSYFDHPPFVSWLIRLGGLFFKPGSVFELRSFFILGSTLTALIWVYILRKKNFSENMICCFLVLMFLNPLLGPGSIVATPDVPLVLFWSLSYLAFTEIFVDTHSLRKKYFFYILLGAALGLGFCSKYHIVLFVLSGLIYLCFNQAYKKINLLGVFLTLMAGFIFSLPVVYWNYLNNWASFEFQLKHGFGKAHYEWPWTLNFYLGQVILMSPVIFYSVFKSKPQKTDQIFSITQIIFFTTSSFKAIVEANWPITSHLHATADYLQIFSKKSFKLIFLIWVIIYLAITAFMFTEASKKALRNQYRSTQIDEILPLVERLKPLYGSSYQIASLLTWRSQVFIPKLNGLSRFDFFDTLPESNPTEKKIFVLKHFDSIWPDKYKKYNKTRLESFEVLKIELYQLNHE
jgi:hypothetical protein